MSIFSSLDRFFFRKISASGFGLMRVVWGIVVFGFNVLQWNDVWRYYSNQGFLPPAIASAALRSVYRFSILDYVQNPGPVFLLYIILLILALLSAAGYRAKLTTTLCAILLFSFHERNYLPLAGGETVLRLLGFLLILAPDISAFSVDRARLQWDHWKTTRTLLPAPRMSIWPYRLLLWQLIVLYVTSAWDKLMGVMWWSGTAVASALHHPSFVRAPFWITDALAPLSLPLSRLTLIFEFCWLLMLIPAPFMTGKLGFRAGGIRRALIIGGLCFHGGILILMHVGSFPYAFLAAYLGLLQEEDFEAMRERANRSFIGQRIYILFDGACGLCQRAMFWITMSDWLKRTELTDFRNEGERMKVASDIPFEDLDKSMHVRFAKTARNPILGNETLKGFDGFRRLSWHVPVLWPVAPFLYIPGVSIIGRKIYAGIAERRHTCDGPSCRI
jgi:predicted DCC family thiol-disulfide oxidoreductase YuxK